jgi:uncharacterized lipoprotein YmbA
VNPHRRLALAGLLLAVLALPGCHVLDPQPDPTRFYVLTLMGGASQSVVATAASGMTIGLGPVNLPGYLDQPWMVTRGEGNRLYVSAHDQWGEPLRNSFKDVLKQDLALELSDDQIIDYPWYRTTAVDRQIIVDIIDFEFDTSANSAQIRADWRILNIGTGATDARGQFVAAQGVAQPSGLERAGALSKLVHELAQMLAQQLRHGPAIAQEGACMSQPQTAFGD